MWLFNYDDGESRIVFGIFSTEAKAELAKKTYIEWYAEKYGLNSEESNLYIDEYKIDELSVLLNEKVWNF
jgi:hypothetical protein